MGAAARFSLRAPRTWIIVLLATVLVATIGTVAFWPRDDSPVSAPTQDCSVDTRNTAEDATAAAAACEIDIEIAGERTPWERNWATSEGTFRAEVASTPTATNVNGEWEPIDTTVESSPSEAGMLALVAPTYHIQFNPGGEAGADLPLAQIEREGATLAFHFPMELGAPSVTGSTVTYPLFAGASVEVHVNADGTGFLPIIKLDSRQAATEFATRLETARGENELPGTGWELPFRLELSDGLSVQMRAGGAFDVVDASGGMVFTGPPSMMWDESAGKGGIDSDATAEAETAAGDVPLPSTRGAEPWPGDSIIQMPVRYEAGALILGVDEDMLADAATQWPVRIDPKVDAHGPTEWTMLRTGGFTSSVWKFDNINSSFSGGGMGRCSDSSCNSAYTAGLVWEFTGLSALAAADGDDVISAQLRVKGLHSYNCTAQRANLYSTSAISSSSTWSSVTWGSSVGNASYAHRESCDNVRYVTYNATNGVKAFAENNRSYLALGLRAHDETNMNGWKRIHKTATLQYEYNRPPNPVTAIGLADFKPSCATGAAAPYIPTLTPTLNARGTDPDGDPVGIEFVVVDIAKNEWVYQSPVSALKTGGTLVAQKVLAGKLKDNTLYHFRAKTTDEEGRKSTWGTACEFRTDTTAPPAPTLTALTTGVGAVYGAGVERGGVGAAGKFRVALTEHATIAKVEFSPTEMISPDSVTVAGTGTYDITFTPSKAGPITISATSVGRNGLEKTTQLIVDVAGPREGAIWTLDEGSGHIGADTAGTGSARPLTFSGGSWTAGPHALFGSRANDKAVLFDGINDAGTTASPPITTSGAYAISAFVWINPEATGKSAKYTALSQDGNSRSAFELGYRDSCASLGRACWSFTLPKGDSSSSTATVLESPLVTKPGEWVHLVADRNSDGSRARLWACPIGTPAAPGDTDPVKVTGAVGTGWKAEGAFAVGRGKYGSAPSNWWPGRIDNVRVFPGQVLDEAKVKRMCSGAEATDFGGDPDALDPTVKEQ